MFFERLKGFVRTLRFKLLAWNTAVVLLMVLPTLFLVREFFRRTMYQEFDQLLREDVQEVRLTIEKFYPRLERAYQDLELKARGHVHRKWFVQLFDRQGRHVWASSTSPPLDWTGAADPEPAIREVASVRFLVQTIELTKGPPFVVVVGASLENLHEDMELLTHVVFITSGLILVLAPLGGAWLSGRATQPLTKIIETTADLRPSSLAERLPMRGTGDELDQLSLTINSLLDRIARYVEQKQDVLANAAHELRSPLAAIRTSAEVALAKTRSTEEYANLLGDIMEECSGLETLVNQLLLLAAGEAGSLILHPRPVDFTTIVRKSVAMFEGVAEAASIELHAGDLAEISVRGEETHLRQVVNNLIDNAIKFSPAAAQVTVVLAAAPTGTEAVLTVSDTGIGIAPDDLPRIFERFYQSDKARPRRPGRRGSGLGLSICHAIVTGLGGRITVDSMPGKGSTFRVYLLLA